ncbi:MAG: heavy metal translocating P-type ATPase metal-binding domain-containing protein [Bacteroidota bacterium]
MERIELQDTRVKTQLICYHCGDESPDDSIHVNEKIFCCNGCKTVYEILEQNNLCDYYSIDKNPGITQKQQTKRNYDFLLDEDLVKKLIEFSDGKISKVTFNIPQMHCSSCIWILENLYKLNPDIINSQVNFLQKKIFINFSSKTTNLKEIVELLDSIGYEPQLNFDNTTTIKRSDYKKLYYKIGVAGFAFGNIMLLSFPEYLSLGTNEFPELKRIFAYINILLSLPVFFFSSSDYFISSWKGLKKKIINIDVPLALGILILFIRSLYEIIFLNGAGYLDTLAGLIFFLLIGKLFQNKTYDTLNFERNYKSYFPISVTIKKDKIETTIPIEKLGVGNRIVIRNNELIPADSILIKGKANIDYSFVTGESIPATKVNGETIFAGGRQIGSAIELETIKEVSQSYLTQLWNSKAFNKEEESKIVSFANSISEHFTIAILLIGLTAATYWYFVNPSLAFNSFTAVLIIACPCALALSTPFTMGNTLRIFGKNKFYLKNTYAIEKLAAVDTIVLDKTGTITENGTSEVKFIGDALTGKEEFLIKSTVRNSSHPLSLAIYNSLTNKKIESTDYFDEEPGKGITAVINGFEIKIGSKSFVNEKNIDDGVLSTKVYVSFNRKVRGYFNISNKYRDGLKKIIFELAQSNKISILSGDNESEKNRLQEFFGNNKEMLFNQSPFDKLNYITSLQQNGNKVLMIGDGLNDAGALKQSDIGISISDDVNNFSPACDGILDSNSFSRLSDFIKFAKKSKNIIISSFVLSTVYNLFGLYYAVSGTLSPIIAAVLMPVSSISVVLFTTLSVNFFARKRKFN